MPFDPAFDDIYRLGIKETAEKLGIRAERVDTGRGWTFKQDGQEFATRQDDGDKNGFSHFIRSPVRRLQAKSWAEIRISGEKILETKYGANNRDKVFMHSPSM